MAKLIMTFHIHIDEPISRMNAEWAKVTIIPFSGYVDSDLFTGTIVPGAADIQTTDGAGVKHMCAKYMFKGYNHSHEECCLYVENNGYFERNHNPSPFEACPKFLSDNKELNQYLSQARFRAEGHNGDNELLIKIYDILGE
ncbi:MAG: DUF3237 domain-containing protein [Erysipelotrichaceae bacterium]|nr:DUF3237 domain-containing protein [Erysipelotrichaceae bacterium]